LTKRTTLYDRARIIATMITPLVDAGENRMITAIAVVLSAGP
jgi:hypothetical protein